MISEPQEHLYAVVDGDGQLATQASSGRWAFRTLNPAAERAHQDRQTGTTYRPARARVARYKFDGWAT